MSREETTTFRRHRQRRWHSLEGLDCIVIKCCALYRRDLFRGAGRGSTPRYVFVWGTFNESEEAPNCLIFEIAANPFLMMMFVSMAQRDSYLFQQMIEPYSTATVLDSISFV